MKKYLLATVLMICSICVLFIIRGEIMHVAAENDTETTKEAEITTGNETVTIKPTEVTSESVTGATQEKEKTTVSKKEASHFTGWKKSRYYKKGKYVKGFKKIKGKYYYFSKNGKVKTGFKTLKGKKYFFRKNGKAGVKGSAVTGRYKISRKWYFFSRKGILKKKTTKEKGTTYFINEKGILEAYCKKNTYYKANGKKMKSYEKNDYQTFRRARAVVKKITNSKMSKAQKIKACFAWVRKKPYITYRKFSRTKDWPATYANDHFMRKGGDCHADGAAMAYLARALGIKNVYVCLDCNGIVAQGHCWAEINGRVYDPLFIEKGDTYKYYNGSYRHYELRPILHLKIAQGY